MQLSSTRTEPQLLEASKETARAARDRVLALLPDGMAGQVCKHTCCVGVCACLRARALWRMRVHNSAFTW